MRKTMKNNTTSPKLNLNQLVGHLKSKDANYARLSKVFQIFYWILIPVYSYLGIRIFIETKDWHQLVSFVCFAIAMIILAFVFGKHHKQYNNVDYSLPTVTMLKSAADRYKPLNINALYFFIALVFLDAGLCCRVSSASRVLQIQFYFWGLMGVAVLIGLIRWYYKYKPLRDRVLEMIKEIEDV